MRTAIICGVIVLIAAFARADEPKRLVRPITEAQSVIAVYYEDWGLASARGPEIIFVAWPDGHLVWSDDRIRGGPPYHAAQLDPQRFAKLIARFENDGLFADGKLNDAHWGPDSEFITVLVKSGKRKVDMSSWHELFEANGGLVTSAGVLLSEKRPRLEVLRKEPADYLFYRMVWSETRTSIAALIPSAGQPTTGSPRKKAGELWWQEPLPAANRK
ncbi:MAG TPA: hypothetical protein VGP63_00615 [Planctomycetaceae bacterium]|jgi:hypothetical protein|nr:hypothetical protein [Planctomycetaceae bacterium]